MVALGIQPLAKIALLIQEADTNHRQAEFTTGLEIICGQDAESAGINGQRFIQAEFHAEIGDVGQRRLGPGPLKPCLSFMGCALCPAQFGKQGNKFRIPGKLGQVFSTDHLQDKPRVMGALPEFRVNALPEVIGGMAPGPAQVNGQFPKIGKFFRQIGQGDFTGCGHSRIPRGKESSGKGSPR